MPKQRRSLVGRKRERDRGRDSCRAIQPELPAGDDAGEDERDAGARRKKPKLRCVCV